ncbi:hypothetical protein HY642_02620 [Candidatus Woesearchaeota archaeon]|nr:hypothetical protein [Candidatus Woesearchaeota archaeon]
MQKRGQVAVFIIVGILVLLTAVLLIYSRQPPPLPIVSVAEFESLSQQADNQLRQCLKEQLEADIVILGRGGGSTRAELAGPGYTIPVLDWYTNGRDTSPSLKGIEQVLAQDMADDAVFCLGNISVALGRISQAGSPDLDVIIGEETVTLKGTVPYNLVAGDKRTRRGDVLVDVPVRLGHIIAIGKDIVRMEQELNGSMDIYRIMDWDVQTDIYPRDNGNTYVAITDHKSKLNAPYVFVFGNVGLK